MSRTVDNLTVREKLVSNEIQSIFNSSVNQRCTNIQADNISCNTISYVNGPAGGGGEITSTDINTNTYNINSIDYTYYFIKNTGNNIIFLNNLPISNLGKVFYVFYRVSTKDLSLKCNDNSFIMKNINASVIGNVVPTIYYSQLTEFHVVTDDISSKNYLFRFTPVINDGITYYYVDEYYPN